MEFLAEYGMFLAKTATLLIGLVIALGIVASFGMRNRHGEEEGHIELTPLNERYRDWEHQFKETLLDAHELKQARKAEKQRLKAEKKAAKQGEEKTKTRLFVLDFEGDIKASAVDNIRNEISALLTFSSKDDEVLVRLESAGGMVHSYGLAASQLRRISDAGMQLTVAVDKVAASGGYMMACVARHIIAAPFAVLGSIGVIAQLPNFNRLLKKHDVDIELHTAGEFKRTLTMLGENTESGREKFRDELQDTHELFKEFVAENRPQLDIAKVATGEVWYGRRALDCNLIDDIMTSDDYLMSRRDSHDLVGIKYVHKKSLPEKLGLAMEGGIVRAVTRLFESAGNERFIR